MRRPLVRWLGAAVVVAAIAGCGGGGGGGGGTGAGAAITSTIDQFVKQRDCSALTPAARSSITGEGGVSACSRELAQRVPVHHMAIGKITTSGAKARAAVTIDGQRGTISLVEQAGRWLVSDVKRG